MRRTPTAARIGLSLVVGSASGPGGCGWARPLDQQAGVVVESVTPGGAAARGGLEPGDRVVRWRRAGDPERGLEPAGGALDSLVELYLVESLEAPLGAVSLELWRGRARLELALPPAHWRLEARPALGTRDLEQHLEASHHVSSQRIGAALELWRGLAARVAGRGRPSDALWLLSEASATLEDADEPSAAAAF